MARKMCCHPGRNRIATLHFSGAPGALARRRLYNGTGVAICQHHRFDRRRMSLKHRLGAWWMPGVLLAASLGLHAQNSTAPFDLNGPRIDMRVTRGGKTLPIAEVPNLQPGDKIWVHLELPQSQSARYLLVVAFLRGATNPPPEDWFLKQELWQKKVANEGIQFTVPA